MRLLVVLLALVALGCPRQPDPVGPPAGFEHAYAGPSCAPWDGYAASIVLRSAPLAAGDSLIEAGDDPLLRLGIYPRDTRGTGLSGLRPGTYRWPAEPEVAGGTSCESGRCTGMPRGRIIVREADANGRLRGNVDLLLADGRSILGTFDAEWRPRRMLCG